MLIDQARIARLERAQQYEERRVRLRFPDARAKLRTIKDALESARNGEPPNVTPRVTRIVSEVGEEIERYQARMRAPWRWWKWRPTEVDANGGALTRTDDVNAQRT